MDYQFGQLERSYEIDVETVLEGERSVVARINTSGVDRLKTVIDPLGCDVSHFNKTRSVLWNHGLDPIRGTVPIGVGWAKVRRSERDMIAKTVFAKDPEDDKNRFCDKLFDACRTGACRGWSIKAGVHAASPPTKDEIRARPELEDCEMIYRKWDLIEYSLTPTPGNSDCLTMLVSRGLITAPEGFVATDAQRDAQPETDGATQISEKPIERTSPYIETDGKLWVIHHANGERCMALPDPEQADECLRLLTAKPESKRDYYAAEAAQAIAETRRIYGDISNEIKEYIDLYRHGRV